MGSSAKDAWTSHFYFSSLGVVNVVELTMFLELKNPGKSTFSEDKKERVMGIEPTYPAWKAGVLPLNYTRIIGVTGFEPATSWSQTRRSSQAEPHPVT